MPGENKEYLPLVDPMVYGITAILKRGTSEGERVVPPDVVSMCAALTLEILDRRSDLTVGDFLREFRGFAPIPDSMSGALDEIASKLNMEAEGG